MTGEGVARTLRTGFGTPSRPARGQPGRAVPAEPGVEPPVPPLVAGPRVAGGRGARLRHSALPSPRVTMVNRQKNLLEAFTASANAEKAASEDPAAVEGAPSGGPFAPGSGRDDLERSRGSLADTLLHPENRGGLIALVGVLITLAFLAGRMTMERKEAAAAETTGAASGAGQAASAVPTPRELPSTVAREEAPAAEVPANVPITDFEKALSDPRNRYTIKLIEYEDKDRFRDLAWNTLNYLEDQGIDAASLFKGKRLFIVVGAAPNQVDLDDLLKRVKTMDGPPPRHVKAEFSTAYVDKIDNLHDR